MVPSSKARKYFARDYYDVIINIHGIRYMGFEGLFKAQFDSSMNKALTTGVQCTFFEGCTYIFASGLIYLAESLLFYIGAVIIARGLYTYLQTMNFLIPIMFSVTIGSQLAAFTKKSLNHYKHHTICMNFRCHLSQPMNLKGHPTLLSPVPSLSRTFNSTTHLILS